MVQEFEIDPERTNPSEESRRELEKLKKRFKADDIFALIAGWFIVSIMASFIVFYSSFLLWYPPIGVHLIAALAFFLAIGLSGNTFIGYFLGEPLVYLASLCYWIACLIVMGNNNMFPIFHADLFATLRPWVSKE